jgi:hypothetical protein
VCNLPPPNPANGSFNCSPISAVNSFCTATCDADYAGAPSAPRVQCNSTGGWGQRTGACLRGNC